MPQVLIWLQVIGFGRLDEALQIRARLNAFNTVTEEPVLAVLGMLPTGSIHSQLLCKSSQTTSGVLWGGARTEICIISKPFEEMEERVGWTVALALSLRWSDGSKGPLLHGQIRLDIPVSGDGVFMAEPQRNHCEIHNGSQINLSPLW